MKKTHFSIQVPEPCHEDWNQMTLADQGRFCQACERNLVDFTKMTDHELVNHFTQNKGKVCGRFSQQQLDRNLILPQQQTSYTKAKALGLMFSGLLATSSVQAQSNNTQFPLPIISEVVTLGEVDMIEGPEKVGNGPFVLKGQVVDAEGEPLIGASILIRGTTVGTISDIDGHFTITIPDGYDKASLEFSYTGFQRKEIIVFSDEISSMTVVMDQLELCAITGIVVMGYGAPFIEREPEGPSLWTEIKDLFKSIKNLFKKKSKKKKEKRDKTLPIVEKDHQEDLPIVDPKPEVKPKVLSMNIYPNPFNLEINVEFNSDKDQRVLVNIYDNAGKLVKSMAQDTFEGENKILVDLSEANLPNNKYHLQIIEENGQQHSDTIIKLRP